MQLRRGVIARSRARLTQRQRQQARQWALLGLLSIVFSKAAGLIGLPAPLLFGCMIGAICIAGRDGIIRVPQAPFIAAQGVIGCLVGQGIPSTFLADLVREAPFIAFGVGSVLVVASALGLAMTRAGVLPGTTAIWGTSPGASTPMIVMSESFGGDMRLVAVMQYVRVACVVLVATLVSRLWVAGPMALPAPATFFPAIEWQPFLAAVMFATAGAGIANRYNINAGPLLVPLAGVLAFQSTTGMTIQLPPWLLALSYAIAGWTIGLRFTRPILLHAFRVMPMILASTLTLIACCGLIAWGLVLMAGVDPLTAYLATSPGGLDSIAIIAASSNADIRFVMSLQTTRLILAMLLSPGIARFMAVRAGGRDGSVTRPGA